LLPIVTWSASRPFETSPVGNQAFDGPGHPPYERFIAAPGHQLGFNDLKVIEAHELLNRILGRPALTVDFEAGLAIERAVHAIARSSREGRWITVG
jgi:predicted dehydrogenase